MQEAFFVASEVADGLYGPYSKPVADRVLKIVRMASDETAELEVAEVDMFGEQLQSGLLPFKVCVVVQQGKVQDVEVSAGLPYRRESWSSGRITGSTLSGPGTRARPRQSWQVCEKCRLRMPARQTLAHRAEDANVDRAEKTEDFLSWNLQNTANGLNRHHNTYLS